METRRPGELRSIISPLQFFMRADTYNLVDSASPDTPFPNTQGPLTITNNGSGGVTRRTALIAQFPQIIRQGDLGNGQGLSSPGYDNKSRLVPIPFWSLKPSPANGGYLFYGSQGTLTFQTGLLCGTTDTPPKPPYDPATLTWNKFLALDRISGGFASDLLPVPFGWSQAKGANFIPGLTMIYDGFFTETINTRGAYAAYILLTGGSLSSTFTCDGADLWAIR